MEGELGVGVWDERDKGSEIRGLGSNPAMCYPCALGRFNFLETQFISWKSHQLPSPPT